MFENVHEVSQQRYETFARRNGQPWEAVSIICRRLKTVAWNQVRRPALEEQGRKSAGEYVKPTQTGFGSFTEVLRIVQFPTATQHL